MNRHRALKGRVTASNKRGRSLGYPTANIKSSTGLKNGIYFGFANLGTYHQHPAIIFIGIPTTVGDSGRRAEAYLLDITDKDYYGLDISLDIRKFHRPSKTFDNIDELKAVIKDDEIAARKWFRESGK